MQRPFAMPAQADLLFAPVAEQPRQATTLDRTEGHSPDEIVIVIDGRAVAKGRPKFTRQGFAYTPAKTRAWESHARLAAQEAMAGRAPLGCAVACHVVAVLPIPASFSRAKRELALAGRLWPVTRPDVDNYAKGAMDAINTIVMSDDSQVARLTAEKRYGDDPRLEIRVRPMRAA